MTKSQEVNQEDNLPTNSTVYWLLRMCHLKHKNIWQATLAYIQKHCELQNPGMQC